MSGHPGTDLNPRDPLHYGGRDLEDRGGGFLREQRMKYCGCFLRAVAGDKHRDFCLLCQQQLYIYPTHIIK